MRVSCLSAVRSAAVFSAAVFSAAIFLSGCLKQGGQGQVPPSAPSEGQVSPSGARSDSVVTILHVSDYHSHAVPFYSEGEPGSAGLARAVGYLRPFAKRGDALVFSGGDTMNAGSPSFSDKHRCADWPMWNGILDAMALGNHDADYGPEVFASCRQTITYPILSANTIGPGGNRPFSVNGKDYLVFSRSGVRIGVFALAGADFERLVPPERRPVPGAAFGDPLAAAREIVSALREREKVAAVVLIGHSLWQDDRELARKVPGIDLILGSHSHRKEELTRIEGTKTWMISPAQYLTHVSKVELRFSAGTLSSATGGLIRMGASVREDPAVAARVRKMQEELIEDPRFRGLLATIGTALTELGTTGQFEKDGGLANLALDEARGVTGAHAAFSTASAFREPIPPGPVSEESLRAALPYPNRLLLFRVPGRTIEQLLVQSVARAGTDAFSQVSGIRFRIESGRPREIRVLRDPGDERSFEPLQAESVYEIAVTDFQARVAEGYRELLRELPATDTGWELRQALKRRIQKGPVEAVPDGRISP